MARAGEGSAHPGGFGATKRLLRRINLPAGSRVLEVGCGTGRTACYLSELGYDVIAVDRNPLMLEKARRRAQGSGSRARFVNGDAASLPFPDSAFDMVFVESVSAFVPGDRAFREYYRVLKPNGRLLDRELAFVRAANPARCRDLVSYYGLRHLKTAREWTALAKECRFRSVKATSLRTGLAPTPASNADPGQDTDPGLLQDPDAVDMLFKNFRLMNKYRGKTNSVLISAIK
nr:class I SAM-dependent methyltransferase [Cohnella zeiphila]